MKTFLLSKGKPLLIGGVVILLAFATITALFFKQIIPSYAARSHKVCAHGFEQQGACHNLIKSFSGDGQAVQEEGSFFGRHHSTPAPTDTPTPVPTDTPTPVPTDTPTPTPARASNNTSLSSSQASWPIYNPPPRVDPIDSGQDSASGTGPVIDGVANIYLIFWVDSSFQPVTPTYVRLIQQFLVDVGNSPFYANLMQYPDSNGHAPTGARLAATYVDTRSFPANMVAEMKKSTPNWDLAGKLADQASKQEIAYVAQKENLNIQDVHNLYIMLPTFSNGCGYHGYLGTDQQKGSPWAFISYSQNNCGALPQSPNHDLIADQAIGTIGHELAEAVTDPHIDGWGIGSEELVDPCPMPADTIDPQTNGNVTWHGHSYILQEVYDHFRHGCTLEGP